ncbi:MAG: alpha/beta hydrolase, partial [Hymenobacteraceae bacterium]|nr:alpha/beta hydrolase [Hymenobacteraceae bacterium]MDX5396174.1 alpha/beta hydrolase [Hymenobacteraceae bacterium]MDX5512235.1 alpha/beta hydrolase [Hymenobacteraceae bacterium]
MAFIELEKSKLHYRVYGAGSNVLLAFHGYGQESHYFQQIAKELGPEYTLYAFDLYIHGGSYLQKKHMPLTKPVLAKFIRKFLKQEQVNKF